MKMTKLFIALALTCGFSGSANAAYKVNMIEVQDADGSKILVTGSGSFNISGLLPAYDMYRGSAINPVLQWFDIGMPSGGDLYYTINAPAIFSNAGQYHSINAAMPSGPSVGVIGFVDEAVNAASDLPVGSSGLMVPAGYISGTELSLSTSVFWGTFAGFGLIEGRHEYSWGTGVNADGMTVEIGSIVASPVPEISIWMMLLVGFGMIGAATRYRRKGVKVRYA